MLGEPAQGPFGGGAQQAPLAEELRAEVHELGLKKMLARLLQAWADHHAIELNGFGSWTLKSPPAEVSAEPDECYVLDAPRKDLPDLAGRSLLLAFPSFGAEHICPWVSGSSSMLRGGCPRPESRRHGRAAG